MLDPSVVDAIFEPNIDFVKRPAPVLPEIVLHAWNKPLVGRGKVWILFFSLFAYKHTAKSASFYVDFVITEFQT